MEYYNTKQFAEKINISNTRTIYNLTAKGILPKRKTVTGVRYFTEDDVKNYYEGKADKEGKDNGK